MFTELKNNRFQKKLMMQQDTIYEYSPLQLSTLATPLLLTYVNKCLTNQSMEEISDRFCKGTEIYTYLITCHGLIANCQFYQLVVNKLQQICQFL